MNKKQSDQPEVDGPKSEGDRRQRESIRNTGIGLGIILLIIAVSIAAFTQAKKTAPARIGYELTDFSLQDLSGKSVNLSDFRGQPILINAWATWCPPCKAEMPDLQAFYEANRDTGLIILAINAGDSQAVAADFAKNLNLTFPVLLDADVAILDGLGIHSYPTSILVGADGIVKKIHIGMLDLDLLKTEILPLIQP